MKRKIVQFLYGSITNGYISGFINGKIYTGKLKTVCVPGLNCYSCPGAFGACPIGSLQAIISDIHYAFSFYVMGLIMLFGTVLGRWICGWLCPFGLIQELLHKIPSPKWKIRQRFQWLKYLKYFILIVFVLVLPVLWVNAIGLGDPTFCKYICPAGTLEAGIPLILSNQYLRSSIGLLFYWKLILLLITIIASVILFRPFCQFACPLGAIYGLFNPISIYLMQVDEKSCTKCGQCSQKCNLNIHIYKQPNSPECIRCGECISSCPHNAIRGGFSFLNAKKVKNSY